MLTGIAYSNILATVAVAAVLVVGWCWIAPKLYAPRCFFVLSLWGIPFVIGQYCQEREWGPEWVQRHLLDLAYVPWGTALVMSLLFIGASLFHREMAEELLVASSFAVIFAFGYVSELWDTAWAWYATGSIVLAVDVGDYIAITIGVLVTAVFHLRLR